MQAASQELPKKRNRCEKVEPAPRTCKRKTRRKSKDDDNTIKLDFFFTRKAPDAANKPSS